MQQHYDATQFECALWCHTMHEWVMNIHYQTWIIQGQFTNIILTPSKKKRSMGDKYHDITPCVNAAELMPNIAAIYTLGMMSLWYAGWETKKFLALARAG